MTQLYDRAHVELVLTRVGVPEERRNAILDEISFPLDLKALQVVLARQGITHDGLIDSMGGSP
jgi:hypothetical protein